MPPIAISIRAIQLFSVFRSLCFYLKILPDNVLRDLNIQYLQTTYKIGSCTSIIHTTKELGRGCEHWKYRSCNHLETLPGKLERSDNSFMCKIANAKQKYKIINIKTYPWRVEIKIWGLTERIARIDILIGGTGSFINTRDCYSQCRMYTMYVRCKPDWEYYTHRLIHISPILFNGWASTEQ